MLEFEIRIIDCSLRGCKWVPHGTYHTRNSYSAQTSVILNHLEILVGRDYTVAGIYMLGIASGPMYDP